MNKKAILFLLTTILLGINSCKEEDEPMKSAMTTIHGRFVEFGTNKGIEGLPVSLLKYVGFGLSFDQLTDVIYTDSAGNFTFKHVLEKNRSYSIYSYDMSFTYSDNGNGHYPSFDNLILGKPIQVVYEKYTPAWVNVRVINQSRPIYSSYDIGFSALFSIDEKSHCYDTTFNFKIVGNAIQNLGFVLYKNHNDKIFEKSFPIKVQNWMVKDTTITF